MKQGTILYVVPDDWYFYSHRLPIARAALRAGFRVVVATRVEEFGEKIRQENFELVPLKMNRKSKNPWYELSTLVEIYRLYRHIRPDIVHHVALKPIIYGAIAARLSGVPKVINAFAGLGHVFIAEGFKARLVRLFIQTLFTIALRNSRSITIFQNGEDLDLFVQRRIIRREQTVLIRGSGVDVKQFAPSLLDKEPCAILGARMLWTKGIAEFVAAARIIAKEDHQIRMVLVGKPDFMNPAHIPLSYLEEWCREGIIEWWGHREDMAKVLQSATIAVLPSYREGLPKFLLEAAATGLPMVATDTPGCREVVLPKKTGILVSIQDAEALAQAIIQTLSSPKEAKRMGKNARDLVVANFSEEIVIEQTLSLYQKTYKVTYSNGFCGGQKIG